MCCTRLSRGSLLVGIEDRASSAANIAGYWVLGTAQGVLVILVPMFVVGMASGFLRKVIRMSAKIGGD